MRRAIVMGSNGPAWANQLKFAQTDALRIADVFSGFRCNFTVNRIDPDTYTDVWNVREQVFKLAEECADEDTFICYFSGHGVVEKGELFLLWGNSSRDRLLSTSIPVVDIVRALRYCRANSKLLILDCCNAGAAVSMSGFKDATGTSVEDLHITPDNHLVLMASDRFESARELDILEGSFLTINICAALGEKLNEADEDGDRRLSVNELRLWLERCAKEHNKNNPTLAVPYPYLFGRQKGEFYLTTEESWQQYEITFPDGSDMVLLSIQPENTTTAVLIGKYPVTNGQYKNFVQHTGYPEPVGERFINGQWQGPFNPWSDAEFSDPDKPIVCVNAHDAMKYCAWVEQLLQDNAYQVALPLKSVWDFAAFGTAYPNRDPRTWLNSGSEIHHRASSPAKIDREGTRTNVRGVSDLIGNVWEWCSFISTVSFPLLGAPFDQQPRLELRGGSYLDNMSQVEPFLSSDSLSEKDMTSHADLGFRIAAKVDLQKLPLEVRETLQRNWVFSGNVVIGNIGVGAVVMGTGSSITDIIYRPRESE
ncbi:SUMF1/EgtB/PvdO family nonheme iron enzyme [Candidatus Chloroploca sp. M-50]|uniref:SUMF1/EgtB/PvdO family nonheme iron enzyme n=1 Tax=Candidatus Chloroploca mongolica TaxID=2528176 RepID=A0ABS4DHK0_9CHLR|nr:SUMF1/EgtB/PvdO family nonheme iron enzyme [Candidatus Chloroploca mongolica]MBP1468913.1 SUMF1/EgtB/PvdO family nonheme iron enzyme [Candidatus Chloroploca mongolica]